MCIFSSLKPLWFWQLAHFTWDQKRKTKLVPLLLDPLLAHLASNTFLPGIGDIKQTAPPPPADRRAEVLQIGV